MTVPTSARPGRNEPVIAAPAAGTSAAVSRGTAPRHLPHVPKPQNKKPRRRRRRLQRRPSVHRSRKRTSPGKRQRLVASSRACGRRGKLVAAKPPRDRPRVQRINVRRHCRWSGREALCCRLTRGKPSAMCRPRPLVGCSEPSAAPRRAARPFPRCRSTRSNSPAGLPDPPNAGRHPPPRTRLSKPSARQAGAPLGQPAKDVPVILAPVNLPFRGELPAPSSDCGF